MPFDSSSSPDGAEQIPASWLRPDWVSDQPRVGALMSDRGGFPSELALPAYAAFNLGDHVGDDPDAVVRRRARLAQALRAQPVWLKQVHGHRVVRLSRSPGQPGQVLVDGVLEAGQAIEADGSWTTEPGLVCTVMVADCLPVLLAGPDGRGVAALHAGWRGLCGAGVEMAGQGVIEVGVAHLCEGLGCAPSVLQAWLGPCIGPEAFEVGPDVPEAFSAADRVHFKAHPAHAGKWLADLPALARARLGRLGVTQVSGGQWCTFSDASRFYSFRRDGVTGRQAAMVWLRG